MNFSSVKKVGVFFSTICLVLGLFSCNKMGSIKDMTNIEDLDDPDAGFAYLQKNKTAKRGVAFKWDYDTDFELLGDYVSWSYNWGNNLNINQYPYYQQYNINFCPMAWSGYNANNIKSCLNTYVIGEKWLLGFNEPNLTNQANMTPSVAAGKWGDVVSLAKSCGAKLVSPAMNWGTLQGWSDGVKWLDAFFADSKVNLNDIDGISVHEYMGTAPAATLKDLDRYKKFGKKLWLTEFCGSSCPNFNTQAEYMSRVFNALEQDDMVERYSWFIPRGVFNATSGTLSYIYLLGGKNPGYKYNELTPNGFVFINLSTFDKEVAYPTGKKIPAEHYRACSVINYDSPSSLPCSAVEGEVGRLFIKNLRQDYWVDYKIKSGTGVKNIKLRYAAYADSELGVYSVNEKTGDETLLTTVVLNQTDALNITFNTVKSSIKVPSGEFIIRLKPISGNISLNWFALVGK